jgi:hypothetical protein
MFHVELQFLKPILILVMACPFVLPRRSSWQLRVVLYVPAFLGAAEKAAPKKSSTAITHAEQPSTYRYTIKKPEQFGL